MIVIAAFFILLLLGIPISMVVLGASTLGVLLYFQHAASDRCPADVQRPE